MLLGVLNMPPDCWTGDPMDQSQRHSYYREAAERIYKDGLRIAELEKVLRAILGAATVTVNQKTCEVPREVIGQARNALMER